jgi:MFS family permease
VSANRGVIVDSVRPARPPAPSTFAALTNTFCLTQVSTYVQQHVPDQLRGRVLSPYSLCWNLLPLGGLLAGALAAAVNARFAVLVGGALVVANALLLLTSRRLRSIG